MDNPQPLQARLKHHLLAHQRGWAIGLLLGWALLNTLLLATTEIMEARRVGHSLGFWEPLVWETSSILMILLCVWPIVRLRDTLQQRCNLPTQLAIHTLLSFVFSVIHVSGMVGLRELAYQGMGYDYHFGNLIYEFLYEYRKDAMTYVIILLVTGSYRFIVHRLQGEASYMNTSETSSEPLSDRLLIKKLGKEFLIAVADIAWIEAAGNYANLHVKGSVYPMRITMAALEQQLPTDQFRRVHRSSIVNINSVNHIQPNDSGDYTLHLHSGQSLVLSRRYRDGFKSSLS